MRCQRGLRPTPPLRATSVAPDPETIQVDWTHLTDLCRFGSRQAARIRLHCRLRCERRHAWLPIPDLIAPRLDLRHTSPGRSHCVLRVRVVRMIPAMIIHRSPFPDVEIPEVPITEYVLQGADIYPDRAALIDGPSGRTYTSRRAARPDPPFAGGLAARGFRPGDTLGLMAPNVPEYAIVFHGVAVAGGTVTTINPTYGAEEVRFQLLDAGASMLVTIGMFADTAKAAIEGTTITEVLTLDGAEGTGNAMALLGEPIEQVAGRRPRGRRRAPLLLGHDRPAEGRDAHALQPGRQHGPDAVRCFNLREHEVVLCVPAVLPHLRHAGADEPRRSRSAARSSRCRGSTCSRRSSSCSNTRSPASSPCRRWCWRSPSTRSSTSTTCRACVQIFSGAAPLGAELAAEAAARVKCEVVQGYGMTELSPVSHATPEGDFRPGTSGVTIPNTEIRIVDPGHRRGPGRRRRGRALGARAAGDEGLPQQRGGDPHHDRRRRLAAHRRRRRRRRAPPRLDRRPRQGAHQVQGLPGPAGRARGADRQPTRRCSTWP